MQNKGFSLEAFIFFMIVAIAAYFLSPLKVTFTTHIQGKKTVRMISIYLILLFNVLIVQSCATTQKMDEDYYKDKIDIKKKYIKVENGVVKYAFRIKNESWYSIWVSTGISMPEMDKNERRWCEYLKEENKLIISYSKSHYPITDENNEEREGKVWTKKLDSDQTEILSGNIEINKCFGESSYNPENPLKSVVLRVEAFRSYICRRRNQEYCDEFYSKKETGPEDIEPVKDSVKRKYLMQIEKEFTQEEMVKKVDFTSEIEKNEQFSLEIDEISMNSDFFGTYWAKELRYFLEVNYSVKNNSNRDVWVCVKNHAYGEELSYGNYEAEINGNDVEITIRHPYIGRHIYTEPKVSKYKKIPAGETRKYNLNILLPIYDFTTKTGWYEFNEEKFLKSVEEINRMTFSVEYFFDHLAIKKCGDKKPCNEIEISNRGQTVDLFKTDLFFNKKGEKK